MVEGQKLLQRKLTQAAALQSTQRYSLRLYVSGSTPRSMRAIANLKRICERYLPNRVDLEVVDIYQMEGSAIQDEQLVAAPTLVKRLPLPLRRLIGDLSDEKRVLVALDLEDLEKFGGPLTKPQGT